MHESLWQSESQNCKSLLVDLRLTFQMVSQKNFFLSPLLFSDKIFPFLDTF